MLERLLQVHNDVTDKGGKMSHSKPIIVIIALAALGLVACGGGGGGGAAPASGGGSTDSLSTIPTADVSSYDPSSTSTASSSESVPIPSKSKSLSSVHKGVGASMHEEGESSRAFCEQNMHKQEIFRNSQQIQLPRCFMEAMETAGLFTIPSTGSLVVEVRPPDVRDEDRSKMCANIPAERAKERQACEGGHEGPGGKTIIARVSREGGLQLDLCEGGTKDTELTYTQSAADTFGVSAVRIGSWQGNTEQSSFEGSISGVSSVTNGVVSLADAGKATVTAKMSGGPGSGTTTFEATKDSYSLKSAFKGGFTDPFSNTATSFTGKAYAEVGVSTASASVSKAAGSATITGCAKYLFTGSPPPMKAANMIPFDISPSQLNAFLQTLGAELGIVLNQTNYGSIYLCPNPNFDPDSPSNTVKPLIVTAAGTACTEVTHTGVECFRFVNGSETNDFGGSKIVQTGKRIANSAASQYASVNAFDVSSLSADIGTIAFARSFDCTGATQVIDFSNLSESAGATLENAIKSCMSLEEKLRDNDGAGGYNCNQEEGAKVGEETKDKAIDGTMSFGNAGGDYARGAAIAESCTVNGSPRMSPERFFVNVINAGQGKYCLPINGACSEFTVSSSTVSGLNIALSPDLKITGIAYGADTGVSSKATAARITFRVGGTTTCQEDYAITQPSFTPPVGTPPAGEMPEICKKKGITDPKACGKLCSDPGANCRG